MTLEQEAIDVLKHHFKRRIAAAENYNTSALYALSKQLYEICQIEISMFGLKRRQSRWDLLSQIF